MLWLYLLSLFPLYIVIKRDADFSWAASYFIINWLGVSASTLLATMLEANLVEIGAVAEMNYAPVVYNLALVGSLLVSLATYRCLSRVTLKTRQWRLERRAFMIFFTLLALVALWALSSRPPLFGGVPVSEYFRSLNSIERFAFISLAISALPLSHLARDLHSRHRISSTTAWLACLFPAALWVLAGEKMGYLLFIFFLAALPWVGSLRQTGTAKIVAVLAAVATVSVTILQYALTSDSPLAQLGARIAMQGQLWYYFYSSSTMLQPVGAALDILTGISGQTTIREMMEAAMPPEIFFDYETASMTGSHFPALLHASGWMLFPIGLVIFGVLFGISTALLRLAVQSESPFTSFLIVACFVFPGIEVWVVGNTSRLLQVPITFVVFFALLLPILAFQLRFKLPNRRILASSLTGTLVASPDNAK